MNEIKDFAFKSKFCFQMCMGRRCLARDCEFSHDISLLADKWWFKGDHTDQEGALERNCWERSGRRDRSPKRQRESRSRSPTEKPKFKARKTFGQGHPDSGKETEEQEDLEESSPPSPELSRSDEEEPPASEPKAADSGSVLKEVGDIDSDEFAQESFDVPLEKWVENKNKLEEEKERKKMQDEIRTENQEQRATRLWHEEMLKRQEDIAKAAEKEAAKPHFTQDNMRDAQKELGVMQNYNPYQRMTEPQIRKAFNKRMLAVHPDKGGTVEQGRRAFAAKNTLLNVCKYGVLPK
jgi:hypothetical protein